MSADNYLLIAENGEVFMGQGEEPCPFYGQKPLAVCADIVRAILFCEAYQQQEVVEYGYSLTQEARERLREEAGIEAACLTCEAASETFVDGDCGNCNPPVKTQ